MIYFKLFTGILINKHFTKITFCTQVRWQYRFRAYGIGAIFCHELHEFTLKESRNYLAL